MKKTIKFMSGVLALAMCVSAMPMSAFAVETKDVTEDGIQTVNVSMDIMSSYTVKIPKSVSMEGNASSYNIVVTGNIAGNEQIKVAPDADFQMTQENKEAITAKITQEKKSVTTAEAAAGYTITGNIVADDATAGKWNGSFSFDIELKELMSFKIADNSFFAEEGMTWGTWIESEYNNGVSKNQYDVIYNGQTVRNENDALENINIAIKPNYNYTLGE